MIRVSLPVLVFIYLTGLLLSVFGAWLIHEWRRQRRERQAIRHVLRCTLCAFEFSDGTSLALPACPRCGHLNERRQLSQL